MEESHLRHLQCSEPFVLFSGRDQNQLRKLAALGDGHAVLTYLLCLYNLYCNVFFSGRIREAQYSVLSQLPFTVDNFRTPQRKRDY